MLRGVIRGCCVVMPVVEGLDDGCYEIGVGFHGRKFVA